jgi:4-hydroxybenzoate polyprenyltransferase
MGISGKFMAIALHKKTRDFGKMIKFSHTIFALPFAVSAVLLAWQIQTPALGDILWILVAMAGARSAAMGFNRIVDAELDARNPRTANREIPSGILTRKEALIFVAGSALVFVTAAAMLSFLCFVLSFPVLLVLLMYSYTKRVTAWCHLVLGFAISLAPAGAWVAITGTLSWGVVFLSAALLTYIAGFDILYACQDKEFDAENGLHSFPVRLGISRAMTVSAGLHGATLVFLGAMYPAFDLHPVFVVFWGIIALLLVVEHRLVHPRDLTRIHLAFFHVNSLISMTLFAGILVDTVIRSA